MNEKQKAFCRNVAGGMNQTKAYENAGYEASHDQARRKASALMARGDIQEEIKRLQNAFEMDANMARKAIVDLLFRVMIDEEGQRTRDRLRAAELLMKLYRLCEEDREDGDDRTLFRAFLRANVPHMPTQEPQAV